LCVALWRSARAMIEWLCTQQYSNTEVAIIFGAPARYRRATVGSSHDDAHPDNSKLHTGLVRPTPALWGAFSSYRPVRAMAVRRCSKCFQLFRAFRGLALFVRGMMHPYFSEGPSKQREALVWLPRRAGSSGIPWRMYLVKTALHRHRTGFEPQRAWSFMKRLKASKILGEAARA
jgi:hypothetical protein